MKPQRDASLLTLWVWSLYLVPEIAEPARTQFDDVIVVILEALNLTESLAGRTFDCIKCGDVLEDLKDPWKTLDTLTQHLSACAAIVASLPNIRHMSTLLSLIFFRYCPYRVRRIHERTYLRFFTLRNVKALFTGAGLSIIKLKRNHRMIERPHSLNVIAPISAIPGLRGFLTFQYLLVAQKDKRLARNITLGGSIAIDHGCWHDRLRSIF